MKSSLQRPCLAGLLLLVVACGRPAQPEPVAPAPTAPPATAAEAPADPAEPAPEPAVDPAMVKAALEAPAREQWYGVYMLDWKVGHARMWSRPAAEGEAGAYATGTDIEMTVKGAGGGAGTRMKVREARHYAGEAPWGLVETRFEQLTPMGSDRRRAVCDADGVVVTRLDDAEAPPRTLAPTRDSLGAALAAMPLELAGLTVGQKARVTLFDWQTERDQPLTVEVSALTTLRRAGVSTRVAVLAFEYEAMKLRGESHVAEGGVMLETSVGPGLKLRLEERDVAKANVQGLDVLGAGVPVKTKVDAPREADRLHLQVLLPDGPSLASAPNQIVGPPASDGVLPVELVRGPGHPVKPEERAAALGSEGPIDSDAPAVVEASKKALAGAGEGADARARALVRWVFQRLDKRLATHVPSASAVLAAGVGDCTEHTWLFVALARAAGLAARPVYGLMYLEGEAPSFGYHAWAEVEIDGRWVPVDPTWDQVPADATHLVLGHQPYDVAAVIGGLKLRIVSPPGSP